MGKTKAPMEERAVHVQSFAAQRPELAELIVPDSPNQPEDFKVWEGKRIQIRCARCSLVRTVSSKKARLVCDDCLPCRRCERALSGALRGLEGKLCRTCVMDQEALRAGRTLLNTHPELAARLKRTAHENCPARLTQFSHRRVLLTCLDCPTLRSIPAREAVKNAPLRCAECEANRPRGGESKGEAELAAFLVSQGHTVERHVRHLIRNHNGRAAELDIVLPALGLAVEFNGDYWHSTAMVLACTGLTAMEYHSQKLTACKNIGMRLVFVWESDWNTNRGAVQEALRTVVAEDGSDPLLSKLTGTFD